MSRVFFHLGLPKTATTTLQDVLQKHPGCAYLGKGLRDDMQPSLSLEIARAVFFADTRRFEAMLPDLRAGIDALAATAPCLVISDEAFTFAEHMEIGRHWQRQTVTDHDVVAGRLARICPDAGILFSVREQRSFFASMYRQLVKRSVAEESFHDFVQREIDALPHRSMLHLLRYDELFDAYAGRFGAERLHVSVYEACSGDFGAHLDAVSAVCGLDPQASREAWGGAHRNRAKAERERDSVRRLRRVVPPGAGKFLPQAWRKEIRSALAKPPEEAEFTPAQEQAVADYFATPNRDFAARAGLDLAGYGYALAPLPEARAAS